MLAAPSWLLSSGAPPSIRAAVTTTSDMTGVAASSCATATCQMPGSASAAATALAITFLSRFITNTP
jgi:hypothetical protein